MPIVGSRKIERIETANIALEINLTREQCFDRLQTSMGHNETIKFAHKK
jgi:predicted oxidoreductase